MTAYYNENDPFAAAWLRELIKAHHIAFGEVDERSIEDVYPNDLRGYKQCHFFAGIGVWSYSLRQAGWPDDRPVWTGSCPCQPFSTAGKRTGTSDERHLWPSLYHLIAECRPPVFFGEQVASKDGLGWFDTVQSDLEAAAYAVGKADLCAAGFGAPHIRQRLYFVADSTLPNKDKWASGREQSLRQSGEGDVRLANSERGECRSSGLFGQSETIQSDGTASSDESSGNMQIGGMAVPSGSGQYGRGKYRRDESKVVRTESAIGCDNRQQVKELGVTRGFWKDAEWINCLDGRQRPVESGTFPLAHGATNRMGRLRGYGNALVAPVATAFINAFLEIEVSTSHLQ